MEHQEEEIALSGDDVVIVRNTFEPVHEQSRDVADRLLSLERDPRLFADGGRTAVGTYHERADQIVDAPVRDVGHRA